MSFLARRPDDAPERPDFEHDVDFLEDAQKKLEAIRDEMDKNFRRFQSSEGESAYATAFDMIRDAIATLRNAEPE